MSTLTDEQLMSLWTAHSPRVFAYIFSLEPHQANAEDIFQETGMVVWAKRAEFVPETDFCGWACRIAYINVLRFSQQHRRIELVDEKLLEILSAELQRDRGTDSRLDALALCLGKLTPRDRHLLELRYGLNKSIKEIAAAITLSIVGVYKALQRIHESLLACVQRELARRDCQ